MGRSLLPRCYYPPLIPPPSSFLHPPTFTAPSATNSPSYYASKSTTSNPNLKVFMVSATFSFSDSSIKQSLAKNCSTLPNASPFDLLTAYFWTSIAKLRAQSDDHKQPISICTDIRKYLRAPLPYGYFGNALYFSQLTVSAKMVGRDLGRVIELVHQHVAAINEDEFWSRVNWLNSRKDDKGTFYPAFYMYGPELTCVNMESMTALIETHMNEFRPLMYRVEFLKDQKPIHVSYRVENMDGEGWILVMPSPEKGLARRATVTLSEEEMEKLLQDEDIVSLDPTLLLSGRS